MVEVVNPVGPGIEGTEVLHVLPAFELLGRPLVPFMPETDCILEQICIDPGTGPMQPTRAWTGEEQEEAGQGHGYES